MRNEFHILNITAPLPFPLRVAYFHGPFLNMCVATDNATWVFLGTFISRQSNFSTLYRSQPWTQTTRYSYVFKI